MKSSQKIYQKDNLRVAVSDKFIYLAETYQIWSWGASLIDEKYYSSDKFIKFKKQSVKKNNYSLHRFIDLYMAPEQFLINNGFILQ